MIFAEHKLSRCYTDQEPACRFRQPPQSNLRPLNPLSAANGSQKDAVVAMWRLFWCLLASVAAIREPSAEKNGPRPSMWRDHRAGRVEQPKHDETVDTGFVQGVRLVRNDRQNATKVFVEEGVGVRFVRHDRRHPKPPATNASKVFLEDPVWLI